MSIGTNDTELRRHRWKGSPSIPPVHGSPQMERKPCTMHEPCHTHHKPCHVPTHGYDHLPCMQQSRERYRAWGDAWPPDEREMDRSRYFRPRSGCTCTNDPANRAVLSTRTRSGFSPCSHSLRKEQKGNRADAIGRETPLRTRPAQCLTEIRHGLNASRTSTVAASGPPSRWPEPTDPPLPPKRKKTNSRPRSPSALPPPDRGQAGAEPNKTKQRRHPLPPPGLAQGPNLPKQIRNRTMPTSMKEVPWISVPYQY